MTGIHIINATARPAQCLPNIIFTAARAITISFNRFTAPTHLSAYCIDQTIWRLSSYFMKPSAGDDQQIKRGLLFRELSCGDGVITGCFVSLFALRISSSSASLVE